MTPVGILFVLVLSKFTLCGPWEETCNGRGGDRLRKRQLVGLQLPGTKNKKKPPIFICMHVGRDVFISVSRMSWTQTLLTIKREGNEINLVLL